jgi:tyrosine-protein kinase Etk/Wzc
LFKLPRGPGLTHALASGSDLESVVRETSTPNLSVVTTGVQPPNPSELLGSQRLRDLLIQAQEQYDLVIIDTPPVLAVTDAAIIGNQAGTSLLVARFGMNQARELALARQRFEQNRVVLKGAIFNAVQKRSSGYYSYGYYDYKPSAA